MGQCHKKIEPNIRGKRSKYNTNPKNQGLNKRPQAHIDHSVLTPHPPMVVDTHPCIMGVKTISDFLDIGCKDDVDAKVFRFLYACGIPFNVLRLLYWHEMVEALQTAPQGYKGTGYDKARIVGLDKEKSKIHNALGLFTNAWNDYGVSIVSDGWTNVKGKPLINVLGVSATGAVFLSAHYYSDRFKTGINIA